ncbi:hypothetical protein TUSST3_05540 [Streptomyces sp. TUS-ST3]|nr:hypothetical protein TUSST3_05540 [Streptomyces sp. TUS-ST3]
MTGGTFTRHGAVSSFECPEELVKNADENWPTASRTFCEVTAAKQTRYRDDSRVSPTDWALAPSDGNG